LKDNSFTVAHIRVIKPLMLLEVEGKTKLHRNTFTPLSSPLHCSIKTDIELVNSLLEQNFHPIAHFNI
jgi:hypothetical protein